MTNPSHQPIGIFDSGVGGLTVAAGIKKLLPHESLLYFGDTRHAPYGDKSQETVQRYSQQITRFLIERQCKAVVIACNTASALAFEHLRHAFPGLTIINVIDPVVNHVGRHINHKVGVIGTRATIGSGAYRKKLRRLNPKLHVASAPTPLLVAIAEEGFVNTNISREAIATYLGSKKFAEVSSLILGCTHFPLLQREIEAYFAGRAKVVDSPDLVAHQLRHDLRQARMLADHPQPNYRFVVSEKTPNFQRTAQMFFGEKLELEEVQL